MNKKIEEAHKEIEGVIVAGMIMDFWHYFNDTYGEDTLTSSLCAVGPLQSMIGLAIKNGYLKLGDKEIDG